jgi:hypothetical protein
MKPEVMSYKRQTYADTPEPTSKTDMLYADSLVAGIVISERDAQLEALVDVDEMAMQVIAIKKVDQHLEEAVQNPVQKQTADGTLMKLLKHWGVESGAFDKAEINPTDVN